MLSIEDQIAVVTGAGRGIGRAIAIALGSYGVKVMIVFHKEETEAEEVAQQILSNNGTAQKHQADVSIEADVIEINVPAKNPKVFFFIKLFFQVIKK